MPHEKEKQTTKGKTSNILDLERQLGFWFPSGISRHTKLREIYAGRAIELFNTEIQHLNETWTVVFLATINKSPSLAQQIDTLFDQLAPELWPDQPARDQAYWLIDAAPETVDEKIRGDRTNNGLYTKHLFTSSPEDNKLLRHLFQKLVRSKIIQKRANNNTAQRNADRRKIVKTDDDDDDDDSNYESGTAPAREISVSTDPSWTPELIQFSEEDCVEEVDMTAPPGNVYRRSYNPPPPSRNPEATPDQQSGRNDQAVGGPRPSVPFDDTPQDHELRPRSIHKSAQAPNGLQALPQKRGGDDMSGGPSSKKKLSVIARSLSPEIAHHPHDSTDATKPVGNHVPTDITDTAASMATAPPTHTARLSTSPRAGSVQLSEVSGTPANGRDVDRGDDMAAVLDRVRCFISLAGRKKPGRGSIRLSRITNADELFRWVNTHTNHAPVKHALIIQVSGDQPQQGYSHNKLPDSMVPYILSGVDGQDTFEGFKTDLVERIRKRETSRDLRLTITVDLD